MLGKGADLPVERILEGFEREEDAVLGRVETRDPLAHNGERAEVASRHALQDRLLRLDKTREQLNENDPIKKSL